MKLKETGSSLEVKWVKNLALSLGSLGHCCGVGSIPGLRTSTCYEHAKKNGKKSNQRCTYVELKIVKTKKTQETGGQFTILDPIWGHRCARDLCRSARSGLLVNKQKLFAIVPPPKKCLQ